MVLEVAHLQVVEGRGDEFVVAFEEAQKIISSMVGYRSHELMKCLEHEDKYLLLVLWATLEDHEIGFRQSNEYQEWKRLLHHFYDPFPTVEHYETLLSG